MSDLTPKQKNFCQGYIETGNASEAYRQAYDAENMKSETIWKRSNELLSNGAVAGRIESLQAEHRKRHNITIACLTTELEEARKLAMADEKGASAAVSAIMGKAKLHGLIVDRAKNDNTHRGGDSLDELLAAINGKTRSI